MANKFVIKNGLLVDGRVDVTGSINLSQGISSAGGFTGSLAGTASYATYALNANIDTGSFVQNSATASFVTNSQTGSFAKTNTTNTFTAVQTFNSNVIINATASIAYLNVVYQTASVIYSSGSNQIGDDTSDVQTIIGTTKVSGSLQVTGSIFGTLFGTASWASNTTSASFASTAPITGITGLGSNVATFLQTPTSANLASAVTDETGTGALVFANTPTLTTPIIGAATGTSLQVSGMISGSVIAAGGHSRTYSSTKSCSATAVTSIASLDYNDVPFVGVFIKYVIYDAAYTNMRAGTLMIVTDLAANGTTANIAESTTQDIGNTLDADFTATVGGTLLNINLDLTTSGVSYTAVFDYTLIR